MNSVVLLVLLSLGLSLGAAMPAWAQSKSELVIALSSFSAETLDPALQGHNVKYYLSLMFDYLVGTTADGQPSQMGGRALSRAPYRARPPGSRARTTASVR